MPSHSVEALVIETLALSEHELADALRAMTLERDIYRELAQAAFTSLRELSVQRDRLQICLQRFHPEWEPEAS